MNDGDRCFLCGGRALSPTRRQLRFETGASRVLALECGSCGILVEAGADRLACLDHLASSMERSVLLSDERASYGMDAYTLRMAATRWRRASSPLGEEQRQALLRPHDERAASAELDDLQPGRGPDVSLGVLCREGQADELARSLAPHLGWAAEIVLLVDAPAKDLPQEAGPQIRTVRRPMAGDFAGQRNALHHLARSSWMLQLDADESLDLLTGKLLRPLAALAERDEIVSIGLPRRNLVDGVLSDLYPDTQYRLNRREVRFEGRVHERPVRDWSRSFIALCGAIDHYLTRTRVQTRSQDYEAMAPGHGRVEEAAALLQPFAE